MNITAPRVLSPASRIFHLASLTRCDLTIASKIGFQAETLPQRLYTSQDCNGQYKEKTYCTTINIRLKHIIDNFTLFIHMSIHLCTLYTNRLNLAEPGGSANHNPSGVALAVGHFKSFHVISSIHNLTRSWFSVHPVLQSQRTLDCHGFLMFFSATGQSVRLFLGDSGAAVTGRG